MLQTGAVLSFDKMVANGIEASYASKLVQYGWETITEALKHGGITGMMDRLDNPSKIKCYDLSMELKEVCLSTSSFYFFVQIHITHCVVFFFLTHVKFFFYFFFFFFFFRVQIMRPLYKKHQDDIMTGVFSSTMMADWDKDDENLLQWRNATRDTGFEKTPAGNMDIDEQE